MKLVMLRAGIREEPRQTIDRFKSGLNLEMLPKLLVDFSSNSHSQVCSSISGLLESS